jgi:hypothetical protein
VFVFFAGFFVSVFLPILSLLHISFSYITGWRSSKLYWNLPFHVFSLGNFFHSHYDVKFISPHQISLESNCLLDVSIWVSYRHHQLTLKLNSSSFPRNLFLFPKSVMDISINQAGKLIVNELGSLSPLTLIFHLWTLTFFTAP